jgi:hypothetical protein
MRCTAILPFGVILLASTYAFAYEKGEKLTIGWTSLNLPCVKVENPEPIKSGDDSLRQGDICDTGKISTVTIVAVEKTAGGNNYLVRHLGGKEYGACWLVRDELPPCPVGTLYLIYDTHLRAREENYGDQIRFQELERRQEQTHKDRIKRLLDSETE